MIDAAYSLGFTCQIVLWLMNLLFVPLFIGMNFGVVGGSPEIVLRRAIMLSALLFLVTTASFVVYDLGGDIHGRWSVTLGLEFVLLGIPFLLGLMHAAGIVMIHGEKMARPLLTYAVAVAAIWGLYQIPGTFSTHSDARMVANFSQHKAEFGTLAVMLSQDSRTSSICPVTKLPPVNLSPERLAEYRRLLNRAGIHRGVTREPRDQLRFRYWSVGGISNIEKGYAFVRESPGHEVESLDNLKIGALAYRRIFDQWYIYYHNMDSVSSPCG